MEREAFRIGRGRVATWRLRARRPSNPRQHHHRGWLRCSLSLPLARLLGRAKHMQGSTSHRSTDDYFYSLAPCPHPCLPSSTNPRRSRLPPQRHRHETLSSATANALVSVSSCPSVQPPLLDMSILTLVTGRAPPPLHTTPHIHIHSGTHISTHRPMDHGRASLAPNMRGS